MEVCCIALAAGVWVFQCLAPVGLEARHLAPAMPALIVLAMTGLRAVTGGRMRLAACAALLAVFFVSPLFLHPAGPEPGYGSIGNTPALSPFRVPRKEWGGFRPLARAAVEASGGNKAMLISSDARGEGMFIAEVAMLDRHRPSLTVERASKILASSTWSGSGYQSLYKTPEEVRAAVVKAGVVLVVTDASVPMLTEHEKLLLQATSDAPALAESTAVRDGIPGGTILLSRMPPAQQ
jgi:hypothetical protein